MIGKITYVVLSFVALSIACNRPPRVIDGGDNYPNPFSPVARIEFSVEPTNGQEVTAEVYDVNGVQMGRVALGTVDTTTVFKIDRLWKVISDSSGHRDSTLADVASFAAGVYFYRVMVGDSTLTTRKFVLMK